VVQIVEQLCIKSWDVTDVDGTTWKAEQGRTYTTTVPDDSKEPVIVFSQYWVPVPKENFVLREARPLTTP
jgi:hypothetical protein